MERDRTIYVRMIDEKQMTEVIHSYSNIWHDSSEESNISVRTEDFCNTPAARNDCCRTTLSVICVYGHSKNISGSYY